MARTHFPAPGGGGGPPAWVQHLGVASKEGSFLCQGLGRGPGLASYSEKSPRALEQCAEANIPLGSLFLLIFSKIRRSILRQQSLKTYRVFQKSKNCPAVWNSFHCINGQCKYGSGSLRIFSLKEFTIRV